MVSAKQKMVGKIFQLGKGKIKMATYLPNSLCPEPELATVMDHSTTADLMVLLGIGIGGTDGEKVW